MTLDSVISYPIPAYQNLPIEPQYYQPRYYFISDVQMGPTTIVTTTTNNDYKIGQQIRLLIPQANGCRELNGQTGFVESIPQNNQVVVNINSSEAAPFIATSAPNQPQILAIGDVNTGSINTSNNSMKTYIPGSFINISPA